MDGESEPNPAVPEEAGEQVKPMDATPSHEQESPAPLEEKAGEAVSMDTEDGATKEEGTEDNDDDVVLVGEEEAPQPPSKNLIPDLSSAEGPEPAAEVVPVDMSFTVQPTSSPSMPVSSSSPRAGSPPKPPTKSAGEPIVIDDEEEPEQKDTFSPSPAPPGGHSLPDSPGVLSSTEPDSEIRIASVTTLGSCGNTPPHSVDAEGDVNLMITSVTSLQGGDAEQVAVEGQTEENGLQISSAFSLNPDTPSGRPTASFNPGRGSGSMGQLIQNGEMGTHNRGDSWISQSASVPRSQKQTGVDSPSPATSLPKPPGQSSSSTSTSGSQTQPRTVKVTCANCKKPLKKGQTAYQRKGSTHLFCSTTCLSAFSHKPAPKKSCTMCKKDITNMKGTIVAQVDSSESFQEFCSTGCLGAYENKQNPPKSGLKTKCTVCGKLTEIRHEVSFKTVTHKICSDTCFNVYRRANGLIMNCCEQCGDYLPSRASANHFLLVDGQQKRFCCHTCIREFKQAHSKLATCSTCKTLIKTGEVLHSIGSSGSMGSYCSVSCMNKGTLALSSLTSVEPSCHFCKKSSLPQYQATLPEGNILNFCSSQCVTKFQNSTVQPATNGQTPVSTTNSTVQLKCNYCRGIFSLKPEILEWEDKVYQFCSKTCCEDYKKLHCIVTFCEYCQEEKTLHETVKFSGVKKPFCSEGCKLLYKQDFIKRLGLKCVSCNHCSQLCKKSVTRQLGGMTRDFCSEACAKKFHDWYHKAARCDCCKVQGHLTESVMWRTEVKQFCDQDCLLKFYCQQNEPIMVTQKGPENTSIGIDTQGSKVQVNQGSLTYSGTGLSRDVKNKAVLCKPLTLTKATYCKPHMQSKQLQTDVDDGVKREYIPVPIPVPVFIPVPMNMYAQVTPTPVSLPLPIPVPVLLPTTLQGTEQIIQSINELKTKASHDSVKVDSNSMDVDQKPDVKQVRVKEEHEEKEKKDEESSSSTTSGNSTEKKEEVEEEDDKYEPDLDLEADFPQVDLVSDQEGTCKDMSSQTPAIAIKEEKKEVSTLRLQPRRQGNKRRAVEASSDSSGPSLPRPSGKRTEGRTLPLKASYGINTWKRWALSSCDEAEENEVEDQNVKARSKRSLLSLSSEELNVSLSRFVKEVSRPNGERYSPDSILYLCLGIQQHLHAKGRKDDLFGDQCFQQFGEELNKVLKDWKPSVLPDGSLWGRVEEQSLWSSRQLGEQSPEALLRSLVYLNTKYLGLRTVEQHLRLSFANVYGPDTVHPDTKETNACIRVPSISQDHTVQTKSKKRKRKLEEENQDKEADEDSGGPAVLSLLKKHERHLYDIYRSKCPTSLWDSHDVFYVHPEPSCDPNNPLWFTSTPLEQQVLESLLTRVLLVSDIYKDKKHLENQNKEEEGAGEAVGEE